MAPRFMKRIPNVEGVVTKAYRRGAASDDNTQYPITGLFVKGVKPPNTENLAVHAQAQVGLTSTTRIFVQSGTTYRLVTPEQLQVGQHVKVWADGGIQTSDPAQMQAGEIVILQSTSSQ